jgi:hypothetical protein
MNETEPQSRRVFLAREVQWLLLMNTAVTRSSHLRPLALRIGVLLSDHLVEERLVVAGNDVTIGTRPRCSLLVPSDTRFGSWRLFRWRRGQCELLPHGSMHGRIAIGNDSGDLSSRKHGPLPLGTHGRIVLGDVTVLFQMITQPGPVRPRLPKSVRSSPVEIVDRGFALMLLLSFALHLGMVLGLKQVDWPRAAGDDIDHFKGAFVHQPIKPRPETHQKEGIADSPGVSAERSKPAPSRSVAHTTHETRGGLVEKVGKMGLLAVLTAKGQDGASALVDLLGNGNVEQAQERALLGVRGVEVATIDTRPGLALMRATGTVADVRGVDNPGSRIAASDTGHRDERRVSRVRVEPATLELGATGQIDEKLLMHEVRERLGAVRACYERALKRNPSLVGKMLMHIVIAPAGTVGSMDLGSDSLDDPEMARCLSAVILRWRFPAFDGPSVEISLPFVFQAGL